MSADVKKETGLERFQLELEFVSALANPWYLGHLAQTGVLDEADFVRYLEYLLYWTMPTYAQYLEYPHAIDFLLLLQSKDFRLALKSQEFVSEVHRKQYYTWANWKSIETDVKSEV